MCGTDHDKSLKEAKVREWQRIAWIDNSDIERLVK
jgi:hypothetical protein